MPSTIFPTLVTVESGDYFFAIATLKQNFLSLYPETSWNLFKSLEINQTRFSQSFDDCIDQIIDLDIAAD